jgi:hypothetical protein
LSIGGKSRLRRRRQSIDPLLNHLAKTVGRELLENVPHLPFTGRDPSTIRRFIHGPQRSIQGRLASLHQLPLKDFLVHISLLKNVPSNPS